MSQPPVNFSTIDPDAKAPTLRRLRQLSRILDKAITIPGTRIGFGLDPMIGLLFGAGDFLGLVFSAYIVLESARLGVPAATLAKMLLNIIIDAIVGAIPAVGDLFDFAWTANEYNIRLLEDHLKFPSQKKSTDKWFVLAVLVGLFIVTIGLVALSVVLVRFFWYAAGMVWGLLTGS